MLIKELEERILPAEQAIVIYSSKRRLVGGGGFVRCEVGMAAFIVAKYPFAKGVKCPPPLPKNTRLIIKQYMLREDEMERRELIIHGDKLRPGNFFHS